MYAILEQKKRVFDLLARAGILGVQSGQAFARLVRSGLNPKVSFQIDDFATFLVLVASQIRLVQVGSGLRSHLSHMPEMDETDRREKGDCGHEEKSPIERSVHNHWTTGREVTNKHKNPDTDGRVPIVGPFFRVD